ncbi:hypothetical protein FDK38_003424 [Candidozyma auris]|nr:hypothetical protein FDK38_003424 [[Candida] auris]
MSQLLTVGSNPNLLFYAWRLQNTEACNVTVVDPTIAPSSPIHFKSTVFGDVSFTPSLTANSVQHLPQSATFDYVILSVPNLQQFQDACTQIMPLLRSDALIVVESTGYVNLEPFVVSSLPKNIRDVSVCSIMNESDIKRAPGFDSNVCFHRALSSDLRIYLGVSSGATSNLVPSKESKTFARFFKMWQLAQEDSKGAISLLKSTNPREFMTYQWKQALPRLVLNPLSVIFEEPYPQDLSRQILAKPLITGLVNEVFKIIKKMDCKLVKGFENETNLIKNWSAYFPLPEEKQGNYPPYYESNTLFYDFYHQREIEVDLLLLQPILLGDDHGVKTPYLENLYSILCQLLKMNTEQGSALFLRKLDGYDAKRNELEAMTKNLKQLSMEKYEFENTYEQRSKQLQKVESQIESQNQLLSQLSSEHEARKREFSSTQQSHESRLADINAQLQDKEIELQQLLQQLEQTRSEVAAQSKVSPGVPVTVQTEQPREQELKRSEPQQHEQAHHGDAVNNTPDLSDLADVAMYGAALNGETPPAQKEAQRRLSERELELQRREQALQEREQQLAAPPPIHARSMSQPLEEVQRYNNSNGSSNGGVYNGAYNAPNMNAPNMNDQARESQEGFNNDYSNGAFYDAQSYQGPPAQFYGNPQQGQYSGAPHARSSQSFPSLNKSQQPNGPYEGYVDQRPPHGLPPNGFPQSALPATLRNPQRYQQNAPPPGPNQPKHRMGSYPNLQRPYPDQMQAPPMGHQQMPQGSMMMGQMPPQQMPHGMSMGGPSGMQRKANRRSAFPQMEGGTLNIDYGGRGGMPMPGAGNAPTTKAKHRSMMPGQMVQPQQSPPLGTQSQQLGQAPPLANQQSQGQLNQAGRSSNNLQPQNHLRPPQGTSNSGSMTSANSTDSPKTSTSNVEQNIRIEVPVTESKGVPPVPDGEKKKKKKKGIFK